MFDLKVANPVIFSIMKKMFEITLFNMEATCGHLGTKIWLGTEILILMYYH